MVNKETYEVDIISTRQYDIDFDKVYKVVVEHEGTDDPNYIPDAFGDNVEWYLEKIYGYDFSDVEEHSMNVFVEMVADDFFNYVQAHSK